MVSQFFSIHQRFFNPTKFPQCSLTLGQRRGGAVSNLEVETDHPIDEGNCVNKNTCLNAIIDEIGHKICRQTMTEVVIKRHLVAEL
jgi:hypothetical protein